MVLLALLSSYIGWIGLSLGLRRYHAYFFAEPASVRRLQLLRIMGWGGLLASFAASVRAQGWQIGPVLWFGVLTVSAVSLIFALPYLQIRPGKPQRRPEKPQRTRENRS